MLTAKRMLEPCWLPLGSHSIHSIPGLFQAGFSRIPCWESVERFECCLYVLQSETGATLRISVDDFVINLR